ncbi:hypothetical protein E4T44_05727 [Aureobasidium sp. EXF-8845]|nr:hypothetical protein E4T44_05727 [Aureobasidium sp. EXF-8845]KAI4850039.1 hypothetical protein E4T45_05671 [Aureobasidium sp. EXF-8846]
MDKHKDGYPDFFFIDGRTFTDSQSSFTSVFWRAARIGERLSPYISVCCVVMAAILIRIRAGSLSDQHKSAFSRGMEFGVVAAKGRIGSVEYQSPL